MVFLFPVPVNLSVQRMGLVQHYLIGYGWNNSNILALEFHLASMKKEYEDLRCPRIPTGGYYFSFYYSTMSYWHQALFGASWYHYFGPPGKAIVTTVGVGWASHTSIDDVDFGLGFLFGVGWEFSKGWSFDCRYSFGKSRDEWGGNDINSSSLSLMFSKMWY